MNRIVRRAIPVYRNPLTATLMSGTRQHSTARPPGNTRILSVRDAVRLRARWRRQGLQVVFTNGVFDILHRGHIDLLARARAAGDILIVGLNNDRSVRRLKGPGRPLNKQSDRATVLAALRSVDYVCYFGADTPLRLIRLLQPDVLVKGAEYAVADIVGAPDVRSWGGRVLRVRMRRGHSSTRLIRGG